jgi:hypothetical protein
MAQRLFSAVEVASQAPPVLPRHGTPGGRLHRRFAHLLPYHRDEFVAAFRRRSSWVSRFQSLFTSILLAFVPLLRV